MCLMDISRFHENYLFTTQTIIFNILLQFWSAYFRISRKYWRCISNQFRFANRIFIFASIWKRSSLYIQYFNSVLYFLQICIDLILILSFFCYLINVSFFKVRVIETLFEIIVTSLVTVTVDLVTYTVI